MPKLPAWISRAQLDPRGVEVHEVRNYGEGVSSRALAAFVTAQGG